MEKKAENLYVTVALDDLVIEVGQPRMGYYSYYVTQEIRAGLQPSPRPERDREREKRGA
jgi:hypothetical protein